MSPFSGPSPGLWFLVLLDTFLRMNNHPRNVRDPRPPSASATRLDVYAGVRSLCPQAIPRAPINTHEHGERS